MLSRCFSQTTTTPTTQTTTSPTSSTTTSDSQSTDPTITPSTEEKKPKIPLKRRLRSFLSTNRQFVINTAIILSAAGASYTVFDQCVDLVSFLQSVNHLEGLTYAFYAGSFVTISTYTIFRGAFALMPVKTAPAYRTVLKALRQNPTVMLQLGAPRTYHRIQQSQGGFQCVTRRNGGFRFVKESSSVDYFGSWERWWRPRRVQFVMSLRGEKADAVLTAQVDHKLNDTIIVKSLSLEHIQPRAPTDSAVSRLQVIDPKGAPWRQEATIVQ